MSNAKQDAIEGRWALTGSCSINHEITLEEEDSEIHLPEIARWLNGTAKELLLQWQPTEGLMLEIKADGSFSETATGRPQLQWFDAEGCLNEEASPFDGRWIKGKDLAYLRPTEIQRWAMPAAGQYGAAVLRYDDGDTKICDQVQRDGERLLRCVNVVTDELYLNRVLMVYERA